MTDLPDVARLLDEAQQAAGADDLAMAEGLLRRAVALQESALGTSHPDLASTLNNLAIVAERTGQFSDAEACYRRAAHIAAEALPADHPLVAASRDNLADFCRARGLPVTGPEPVAPQRLTKREAEVGLDAFAREPGAAAERAPARVGESTSHRSGPTGDGPARRSPTPWWLAGLVILVVALAAGRQWLGDEPPPSASSAPPAPTLAVSAPVPPPQAPIVQVEQQPAPAPAAAVEPSPMRPDAITLATSDVCQSFSPASAAWRCEPAPDVARPGPLVLYTRVRAPRDTVIFHRWYRGDDLVRTARLTVRANPSEGYRTYSRQTVQAGSDWRMTVVTSDGETLFERRITVR